MGDGGFLHARRAPWFSTGQRRSQPGQQVLHRRRQLRGGLVGHQGWVPAPAVRVGDEGEEGLQPEAGAVAISGVQALLEVFPAEIRDVEEI